jgi:glucose-6-phosphate 1-dehydrogenase
MSLPHSLFLVIFGASGDLTRRKLMPALVKIHNEGRFPPHFAIVGCARTAYSDETYRSYLKEELAKSPSLDEKEKASLDDFLSTVYYQSMDPADAFTYSRLNERLKALSPQYENDGNSASDLFCNPCTAVSDTGTVMSCAAVVCNDCYRAETF